MQFKLVVVILALPFLVLFNLSNNFKYGSSFFDKYRYELCTCINLEIATCAQNFNILVTNYYLHYICTNAGSKII